MMTQTVKEAVPLERCTASNLLSVASSDCRSPESSPELAGRRLPHLLYRLLPSAFLGREAKTQERDAYAVHRCPWYAAGRGQGRLIIFDDHLVPERVRRIS